MCDGCCIVVYKVGYGFVVMSEDRWYCVDVVNLYATYY